MRVTVALRNICFTRAKKAGPSGDQGQGCKKIKRCAESNKVGESDMLLLFPVSLCHRILRLIVQGTSQTLAQLLPWQFFLTEMKGDWMGGVALIASGFTNPKLYASLVTGRGRSKRTSDTTRIHTRTGCSE